jgi:hypothetical protein
MTESATYLAPLTREQLADIDKLMGILRDLGGFGCIRIVIEDNTVRFIRLDNASLKYEDKRGSKREGGI